VISVVFLASLALNSYDSVAISEVLLASLTQNFYAIVADSIVLLSSLTQNSYNSAAISVVLAGIFDIKFLCPLLQHVVWPSFIPR
jgi:hypothetical protein